MQAVFGHPSYEVSDYLDYDGYQACFARYGLATRLTNNLDTGQLDATLEATRQLAQDPRLASVPGPLQEKVARRLRAHIARLEADLQHLQGLSGAEAEAFRKKLVRDYQYEVWFLVAVAGQPAQDGTGGGSLMDRLRAWRKRGGG
jgi:hypothetical protein